MTQLTIREVSVVDVAAGRSTGPQTVVISDGLIKSTAAGNVANSGLEIDGRGLFLSPGLIDGHVHLFFDAGPDPLAVYKSSDDQRKLATALRNAASALRAGVTTVRDLGAPPDLMSTLLRQVESASAPGPHILSSGAPLTRPGGHCHFFGGEVTTVAEVRALIERQCAQGARNVKVMASGGGMTEGTRPSEAEFPVELMIAAREGAQANGMTITAHCHATEAIRRAIDAGIPCVEHASFVETSGYPRFDSEIGRELRDHGIVVSPTVASGLRAARLFRSAGHGYHAGDIGAIERLEARARIAGELHDLGVALIAGSDAGTDDTPFEVAIEEVTSLHAAGLSRAEALRTATCGIAQHLGLLNVGEVKGGFIADRTLLQADPLLDLRALEAPVVVIQSGKIVADGRIGA